MANETKKEEKTKIDYFEKRRNFNPRNAKELFGEDKWIDAMNAVSKAGGYGVHVTEEHAKLYERGLFGGFAIPNPKAVEGNDDDANETRAHYQSIYDKINAALNGLK